VFAPTYRTDLGASKGLLQAQLDLECGYRFARSIAVDHGDDLTELVTFVGWSLGASWTLRGGLDEEIDPSGERLVLHRGAAGPMTTWPSPAVTSNGTARRSVSLIPSDGATRTRTSASLPANETPPVPPGSPNARRAATLGRLRHRARDARGCGPLRADLLRHRQRRVGGGPRRSCRTTHRRGHPGGHRRPAGSRMRSVSDRLTLRPPQPASPMSRGFAAWD
jgi:hypothetical protein